MTIESVVDALGIPAAALAIGAISSLLPIISIEVFLVWVTLAHGPSVLVILLATLGQVLGKLPVYGGARGAARWGTRCVALMRAWVTRFGHRPTLLLVTSAFVGLPPFSLISTAAGVLATPLRTFCLTIAIGRALRFAALVALAAR